jgi:hypothetical protein
LTEC